MSRLNQQSQGYSHHIGIKQDRSVDVSVPSGELPCCQTSVIPSTNLHHLRRTRTRASSIQESATKVRQVMTFGVSLYGHAWRYLRRADVTPTHFGRNAFSGTMEARCHCLLLTCRYNLLAEVSMKPVRARQRRLLRLESSFPPARLRIFPHRGQSKRYQRTDMKTPARLEVC